MLFGQKSEKAKFINDGQLAFEGIFNEAEADKSAAEPTIEKVTRKSNKTGQHRGRKEIRADLETKKIVYELSEDQRICEECGDTIVPYSEECITTRIAVIPEKVYKIEYYRKVYKCRNCDKSGIKSNIVKAENQTPAFYNKDELNTLFEVFKGDRLELVVHIAAYYGLRRGEVLGLRWDAVDFKNKTITIQRKVVSDYDENGQRKLYVETRLKTNSTRRTLPLIPHIERMLLEKKELEAHFKKICGSSYDKEFEGFIC